MIFKHKRTEYQIVTDERQYILYKRLRNVKGSVQRDGSVGDDTAMWEALGYYHDIHYLLLKLIKIGCIDNKKAKDIEEMIKESLKGIKTSILRAIEGGTFNDR